MWMPISKISQPAQTTVRRDMRAAGRSLGTACVVMAWLGSAGLATANSEISSDELATIARSIPVESDIPCGMGGEKQLRLDLARPRERADGSRVTAPCVVVIHGGAWRGGRKNQLHQLIQELAARGYVAASVEYRLCPEHVFPAQLEDVKCAIRFLRAHAAEYQIDGSRVGAIGFSAGAHLSMLLGVLAQEDGLHGTGGWQEQSDQVQAVVAYFGPTQLDAPDLPDASKPLVRDFLGGTPEQKPDQYSAASPATWVSSGDSPMLLFQGTKDPLVPHTQAWIMTERLATAGVEGRVELMLGAGHGWGGPELHRTLEATFLFLNERLKHTIPTVAAVNPIERAAATSLTALSAQGGETAAGGQSDEESLLTSSSPDQCGQSPQGTPSSTAAHVSTPSAGRSAPAEARPLFDGLTLNGWHGDTTVFRVVDGAIVGGQLQERIPHNYFLSTEKDYADFELTLEFKLVGTDTNAGVQIRSQRIPDHHEMIGYQADLGQTYWGCLYDESRRNKVLARPDADELNAVLNPSGWNRYRILCQGRRIQLWINDLQTVDYTEEDLTIPQSGKIALQIHGGPPGEAWYRHLRITELK